VIPDDIAIMHAPLKLVYFASLFGGDQKKADQAEDWCAQLLLHFDVILIAPWLAPVRHWVDSGEHRKRGLWLDCEAVRRCDEIWFLCDSELSPGQKEEERTAQAYGVKCQYFSTQLLCDLTDDDPSPLMLKARDALRKELAG
jgi:hypothetical protein